ncbi:tRNA (N6-threonylcarbamoyladenosine(37)-N6)-methyltransferase TrmO [Thermococcus waiotapuensis]|uniref:tRNA (N6-threonylcarbamoyladenosine(37)-N6)-methyltransferase TrmO n=1 Tax=Thermococcus waiotapuensis TaxID=90909 RepID=A0AAE4NVU2_9EURY|nr:tRNA (N6-threonylcarbamoyladenosine(37)-N6)-methyltransferase TrmO [Thermococcus waiotapuensis]MDV3103590.1 tRNA (N6-threonylcarbamoyladenosine(37)-N6)-methyltransferase TrmO [Thermococcus waiotapuensis]
MEFEPLKLFPVGYVRKDERLQETFIEILPEFLEAVEGLREDDWIKLILWFHRSDTPEGRRVLKVHPHGNPKNPLTGVFATRSPCRPNPIALYTVKIHRMEGNRLYIDWIDAMDETPVVDIKIFVERHDCPKEFIEEREAHIEEGRVIGEVSIIPRKSEHLDELEEVSPEEYDAVILEIGPKTTTLTARELKELIETLKEVYENLPAEIKDRLE